MIETLKSLWRRLRAWVQLCAVRAVVGNTAVRVGVVAVLDPAPARRPSALGDVQIANSSAFRVDIAAVTIRGGNGPEHARAEALLERAWAEPAFAVMFVLSDIRGAGNEH